MKTTRILAVSVVLVLVALRGATAEEKPKPEPKPLIPLTVQVVLNEYDGEKKVSSMPYSLPVNADDLPGSRSVLRMGIRVPIMTPSGKEGGQFQYMDVGTDIDCSAYSIGDGGRFKLVIGVSKSSIYTQGGEKLSEDVARSGSPVIRHLNQSFNLLIRDGQTIQTAMATDSVSGHLLKVEVTLHVVK